MTPPDRVPLKPSSFEWMDFWWFGPTIYWLVVEPTPLKNISENGNLPQIGVKIKNIWNRHPDLSEAWESSKWFTTMKYPPCKRSQPVCPEKWLVGIRSFPFGTLPIFRGELAVSFREGNRLPPEKWPFRNEVLPDFVCKSHHLFFASCEKLRESFFLKHGFSCKNVCIPMKFNKKPKNESPNDSGTKFWMYGTLWGSLSYSISRMAPEPAWKLGKNWSRKKHHPFRSDICFETRT